jgi:site-specific DNA-cytosine methylase
VKLPGHIADDPHTWSHYSGFCGIGAFARAWSILGARCVGGFDSDAEAAEVFRRLAPSAQVDGALEQLDWRALPAAGVYGGGSPCTSWSQAGPRDGQFL